MFNTEKIKKKDDVWIKMEERITYTYMFQLSMPELKLLERETVSESVASIQLNASTCVLLLTLYQLIVCLFGFFKSFEMTKCSIRVEVISLMKIS